VVTTPTVGPSPTATPSTTTLPNTGAGNSNGTSGASVWIAGIFLALIAVAVTIRRRALN